MVTDKNKLRRISIVLKIVFLHAKFFWFKSKMILELESGTYRSIENLSESEYEFAKTWNFRISRVLTAFSAPYSRCMKRALIMALMLGKQNELYYLIGVEKENPLTGHAWLELNREVVFEDFTRANSPFTEVRRMRVDWV